VAGAAGNETAGLSKDRDCLMSIALAVMVDALEKRVADLERALEQERAARVALEQSVVRKPGPKPKESNG
jgi:hypothetical protein